MLPNNNNPKKNKKHVVDIVELDNFLALPSFTRKQENDIWAKFGMIIGTKQYFYFRSGNKAIITSRGVEYLYVVKQINDKNNSAMHYKISDRSEWYLPENQWDNSLSFNEQLGVWAVPPARIVFTREEDAINIIESVVMACWKQHNKTLDLNENRCDLFLDQTDFCYTYVGEDRQWHAFYPSMEKLVSYAVKFEKTDFLAFLNSEECFWHREFWNLA